MRIEPVCQQQGRKFSAAPGFSPWPPTPTCPPFRKGEIKRGIESPSSHPSGAARRLPFVRRAGAGERGRPKQKAPRREPKHKKSWRIRAVAGSNPPGSLLLRSHSLLSSIPHFSDDTVHVIAGFSFCCGKGMLVLTRSLVSKPHSRFWMC